MTNRRDFGDLDDDDLRRAVRAASGGARDVRPTEVLDELRSRFTSARRRHVAMRATAVSSVLVAAVGLTAALHATTPAGRLKVQAPSATAAQSATSVADRATTSTVAPTRITVPGRIGPIPTTPIGGRPPHTSGPSGWGSTTTDTTDPRHPTPPATDSTDPGTTPGRGTGTGPTSTTTPQSTGTTTTTTNTGMQSTVLTTAPFGHVTVSYDATHLHVDLVVTNAGYSWAGTQYDGPDEVQVFFMDNASLSTTSVQIQLYNGHPAVDY